MSKKNAPKAKHVSAPSDSAHSPTSSTHKTDLTELNKWFNDAKLEEEYRQYEESLTPEDILEREIFQSAGIVDLEKALLKYDEAYEEEGDDFSVLLGIKGKNKKKKKASYYLVKPNNTSLEKEKDKTLANKVLCDKIAIENQRNLSGKQNKKNAKRAKRAKKNLCAHGNPYPKFNKLKENFLADWYDSHSHDESIWGTPEYPVAGTLVEPRELKSNVTITFTGEEMRYLGERNKANQEMLTSYIKRKALEGFTPKAKETQEEEII
jgi:hypothetical protein